MKRKDSQKPTISSSQHKTISVHTQSAVLLKNLAEQKGISEEKAIEFLLSFYDDFQYLDPDAVKTDYQLKLKQINRTKKTSLRIVTGANVVKFIPEEIATYILSFLHEPKKDWVKYCLVSKEWKELCDKARYFPKRFDALNNVDIELFQHKGNFYLDLPSGLETNFSSYKVPTRKPWARDDSDVVTKWYKLRIDPETLMVHTGDFTFTKTKGKCEHHKNENTKYVPYASAFGCESSLVDDGKASIDLRGTPFAVANDFKHEGWQSNGTWKFKHGRQIVTITGGGYCGWTCPVEVPAEHEAALGGWFLQLRLISLNK